MHSFIEFMLIEPVLNGGSVNAGKTEHPKMSERLQTHKPSSYFDLTLNKSSQPGTSTAGSRVLLTAAHDGHLGSVITCQIPLLFVGHRRRGDFPEELKHGLLGREPGKAAMPTGLSFKLKKAPMVRSRSAFIGFDPSFHRFLIRHHG
jgi:hypothetical protein